MKTKKGKLGMGSKKPSPKDVSTSMKSAKAKVCKTEPVRSKM